MAKKTGLSEGLSVGLRMWLLFLVSFYALGTPEILSILLGAIAGAAAGAIAAWWKIDAPPPSNDETETADKAEEKKGNLLTRSPFLKNRNTVPPGTNRARRSTSLWGWFSEGAVRKRHRRRR